MPLTTKALAKEFLKIPVQETSDDDLIDRLINTCSAFVENYCRRKFDAQAYTEYYSTEAAQKSLMLRQYPVNSITSIHDDPDRDYGAGMVVDADYYIFESDEGIVRFDGVSLNKGVNNIQVIYNAGYATTPYDLEQAVLELVVQKYNSADKMKQNIESSSAQGETVRYFMGVMLPETKAVLDRYRKIR